MASNLANEWVVRKTAQAEEWNGGKLKDREGHTGPGNAGPGKGGSRAVGPKTKQAMERTSTRTRKDKNVAMVATILRKAQKRGIWGNGGCQRMDFL